MERHDAAPIRVNAMALSWSPMQARRVADGGVLTVVRDSLLSTSSHVSSSSSPSLDDESENNTSISPFSQPTASSESRGLPASDQRSAMISAQCTPPAGTNDMLAVPIPLPNGHFSCPYCPRKFSQLSKASHHIQIYRHTHSCSVSGCGWSYNLPKDLLRHSATHNTPEARDRYPCPVTGCSDTMSRHDLLKRHVERFH